jgi:hypothetical protein
MIIGFFEIFVFELQLNKAYKFRSYLTGDTSRLRYRAKPVNAVWGNSRCLL